MTKKDLFMYNEYFFQSRDATLQPLLDKQMGWIIFEMINLHDLLISNSCLAVERNALAFLRQSCSVWQNVKV